MTSLQGRVAFVTGAARGMGAAHAAVLADRGARVALVDLDGDELGKVLSGIVETGGQARAFVGDITDRDTAERLVAEATEHFGGMDVLVHNAGVMHSFTTLVDTDDEQFQRYFAVNVTAPMYLTRAALPALRTSDQPRVVFVSSQWGQVPDGHSYGYMSSKAAQLGLMKAMAKEFASERILVNAVAPGAVETRMIPDFYRETERAAVPVGRIAAPEEISYAIAFLASDEAAFITGQTIPVNGGGCVVGI